MILRMENTFGHITSVANEALRLAKLTGYEIIFDFNEVECAIDKEGSATELSNAYVKVFPYKTEGRKFAYGTGEILVLSKK